MHAYGANDWLRLATKTAHEQTLQDGIPPVLLLSLMLTCDVALAKCTAQVTTGGLKCLSCNNWALL